MNSPLVKINTASPEEIATLYDVGLHRAEDIVSYRTAHGPLHGPEDLAKVEGITLKLATTLAPHIDWEGPSKPEQPKQRDWVGALHWATIFLITTLSVLMIGLSLTSLTVRTNLTTGSGAWLKILMIILGTTILICFAVYAATRVGVELTSNKKHARKLSRGGLLSMAVVLSLSVVLCVGTIIYSQFYSLSGWTTFRATSSAWTLVIGLISFVFLFLFMVPQLIVWRRPSLASNPWLSGVFDVTIGLFGVVLLLIIILSREFLPLWLLLLSVVAGVMVVLIAVVSIRRGESFLHASLDFVDPGALARQKNTVDAWRRWLNVRLPDPVQQRELKDALEDIYRPSPVQTFARVLILNVGGWVVVAAIGAIIELYIQDWWRSLTK